MLLIAVLIACVPVQALAGLMMPIGVAAAADAGKALLPPCHGATAGSSMDADGLDDTDAPIPKPVACERCVLCHLASSSMPAHVMAIAAGAPNATWCEARISTPGSRVPHLIDPPPRRPALQS